MSGGRPESIGDMARLLAAVYADTADGYETYAASLREVMASNAATLATGQADAIYIESPITPTELVEMLDDAAYKARTSQQLCAEQARAHDAFLAAGGEDNPTAKAQWDEVLARTQALMPDWDRTVGT